MTPIIYYRKSLMPKEELTAAQKYFKCVDLLSDIPENSLVIGRYSLYPFYYDQEREILNSKSKLINSYFEHNYIADLINYVGDLKELTPETWDDISKIPDDGPFILKGATNSKKSNFLEYMFAKNKKEAVIVQGRLLQDSLIGFQNIYIRKFESLITYDIGIGGIPISKEFRFFVLNKKIISGAYYWSNYVDEINAPSPDDVPIDFLNDIIERVGNKSNFYAIDVAQKQNNDWIVIELNDGQQSGLSENNPEIFYKNMAKVLNEQY